MALPIDQPSHHNYEQGLVSANEGVHLGNDVYLLTHDGVPTGGDGWCGPGSMVVDYTNKDVYLNTGTKASPTWTKKID